MKTILSIKSYPFRHAVSVGFAVFIAWLINRYLSFSGEYWVVLSALVVSQATVGTPVRQGYIFLTLMEVVILLAAVLARYVHYPVASYVIMTLIFAVSGFWIYRERPISNKDLYFILFFPIVLMIALLSPGMSDANIQNRAVDALMGGLIGIWSVVWVLPVKFDQEFSEGILPILHSMKVYMQSLTHFLLEVDAAENLMKKERLEVERTLQTSHGIYPEWVYEVGFNRGLRSGFRFFLIQVERITEVLFSMEFVALRGVDRMILEGISDSVRQVMAKNNELMDVLIEYFLHYKLPETSSDFTSDVTELDDVIRHSAAFNLEMLELSPRHLAMMSLVRDIKDLRELLLQLAMSLPGPGKAKPRRNREE